MADKPRITKKEWSIIIAAYRAFIVSSMDALEVFGMQRNIDIKFFSNSQRIEKELATIVAEAPDECS